MNSRKAGIIILAAGASSRFEGNKLSACYRGRMLFEYTLEAVSKIRKCPVYIVTAQDIIADAAQKLGFATVRNERAELGISLSIKLGIEACLSDHPDISAMLFCVCDQPELSASTMERIIETGIENPGSIVRPRSGKLYGNPCLWDRRFFEELASLSGDEGGRSIMKEHHDSIIYLDVPENELADIDYREDIKE